jgi:A/G-specific adenine glycosylase
MKLPQKQQIPRTKTRAVVGEIFRWYGSSGRSLPWRNTRNPYRILVSEYMLQQTQVNRVLNVYPQFLSRFPTIGALAAASRGDVLRAWQGLGYNNRAVRLHNATRIIVNGDTGRFPREYERLILLPGVGKYTAHAVLVFAFGRQLPLVEVNIRRVLSRIFWQMSWSSDLRREAEIWELAFRLLPHGHAGKWNHALMDLGAVVCTSRRPACDSCPIARRCLSRPFMARSDTRVPRKEPSFQGIPNRIYRGRIIKELCGLPLGQSTPLHALGESIVHGFTERNLPWLVQLVEDLKTDGLVRVRGNGSARSRKVSLV